ncbi:MAG: bifunctional aminoglycoside phosphotransferase/ATP-binding protein, partial [Gammaproteobacteria bacterium]
ELRLNRRLAENLYLDVVPITGTPDRPIMEGQGKAIEFAVKMVQFPSGRMLAEMAENGKLTEDIIDRLAAIVAGFHQNIAIAKVNSPYGAACDIKKWFVENFSHIIPRLIDEPQLNQMQAIEAWGMDQFQRLYPVMQLRKRQGFVRECHGDLHLGNMTLMDGKLILFDCIEFNPQLRWIDVVSEVAFIFIDLAHFGYQQLAFRFLNRYLSVTGDYSGLALLRFYLVYRALVRAKVTQIRLGQQQDKTKTRQAVTDYLGYANLAEHYTKILSPVLIITHGFSGSGKSTLSSMLAERIGAIHIRSDIERKRLFGCEAMEKTGSGIESGIYSRDASRRTYDKLAELTKNVIDASFSVIADATFLKFEQRQRFRQLASECGSEFFLIDFQAPEHTLFQRIEDRQLQGGEPSEATIDVLMHQIRSAEPLSEAERIPSVSVSPETHDALGSIIDSLPIPSRLNPNRKVKTQGD